MNHIDQGGSAFPHSVVPGMTLRDYFAATAMNGIISRGVALATYSTAAKAAYAIADAMIEARKQ